MQTDYDFDSKVFFSDLKRPSEIGKKLQKIPYLNVIQKKLKHAS